MKPTIYIFRKKKKTNGEKGRMKFPHTFTEKHRKSIRFLWVQVVQVDNRGKLHVTTARYNVFFFLSNGSLLNQT